MMRGAAYNEAHDAICARATELSKKASATELNTLAEAVQRVEFGPHGESTDYRYSATTGQVTNQTTHTTTRYEKDDNGRVGFGEGTQ